jgi:hypothetical protein
MPQAIHHPMTLARSRVASAGAALVGVAAIVLAAYVLIVQVGGALVSTVARAIVLLPDAVVWLTLAIERGTRGWVIAGRVRAAAAGAARVPIVTVTLFALELMGVGALFALRTLLQTGTRPRDAEEINP